MIGELVLGHNCCCSGLSHDGLQSIYQAQGFIVVAWELPTSIGKIFHQLRGDVSIGQPFRVIAPSTFEEWQAQAELGQQLGLHVASQYYDEAARSLFFYRAVTE